MEDSWDVIVVGGSVAGLSAALMLGRSRRRTLVLDAGEPRNRFAEHMHGVLGHEGSPPGELLARGRAEAAGYGVEFVQATVEKVDVAGDQVIVTVAGGGTRSARALVVATGLSDDLPAIPGLAQRWGRSVLHCPYCHGWEVRDQRLGVLPTSPLGLHQAELVRQLSPQVVVFTAGLGPIDADVERRLRSRGIELIPDAVVAIDGDGEGISSVRTADGRAVPVDALFTAGTPRPRDEFLAQLNLARTENSLGFFLTVDLAGRTSNERIWAAGNVVNPTANVPLCIGAGSLTGAAVNAALVGEDFDKASAEGGAGPDEPSLAQFWEARYASSEQIWSGRPNQSLVDVVTELPPGRAVDLGCGEGGDAIWLAQQGWQVTGVDVSSTAIARAARAATAAGVPAGRISWQTHDLATWSGDGPYDLVTASFLHSPVAIPRTEILRRAAGQVAPGGHLLILSHAGFPPWSEQHGHEHHFPTPTEEVEALELPESQWQARIAETRAREATGPQGEHGHLEDVIVLLRRS